MARAGVFAVARGIWDDPDFADEPFTEREAFLWLVGEAAWRRTRVRVGSAAIDLQRGQCAFSTRFMGARWKWSEATVRRFLTRMKKAQIIDAQADARATLITICKYDRFQKVGLPSDAPDDADATQERRTSDAPATQERRKEETGKQGNIEDQAAAAPQAQASAREEPQTEPNSDAELRGWLGPIVGELPVAVDPDLTPIRQILEEPLITRADVEAGVRYAVDHARKRLTCWGQFDPFIRRAAKDRLGALPRGSPSNGAGPRRDGPRNPHLAVLDAFSEAS